MTENYRDMLKKRLEEREKKYQYVKGMLKGRQLTNLTQADKNVLSIVEGLIDLSKVTKDDIDTIVRCVLALEKRISALESEIRNLRETLDTLYKNR